MMKLFPNKKGFTFIEVMVTVVILSVGLIGIFKTLLISMDRLNYLTNRLYATNVLENRINQLERLLRAYKALPIELEHIEPINVGSKEIKFKQSMNIGEVDEFADVYQLDLGLSWKENDKTITLKRSAYISDFSAWIQ